MQEIAREGVSMFAQPIFKGQVAIVTGGGTGLGRAMALQLAQLGARVALVGRRQGPLEDVATAITQAGGTALPIVGDVRDVAAVDGAIRRVVETWGRIDCLINNAAGNILAKTETLSTNAWHAVIDIVLYGTIHCTMAVGKQMIAQGTGGRVLNITTNYASCGSGSAYVVPSACGKAGVLALTRSLAVEWAKYKIRCNAIAPGPFYTEGAFSRLVPPGAEDLLKEKIPLKRIGTVEEMSNLAMYLISDYAGFITGEVVTIDGGEWLEGAGEFNMMGRLPDEAWAALRPKK